MEQRYRRPSAATRRLHQRSETRSRARLKVDLALYGALVTWSASTACCLLDEQQPSALTVPTATSQSAHRAPSRPVAGLRRCTPSCPTDTRRGRDARQHRVPGGPRGAVDPPMCRPVETRSCSVWEDCSRVAVHQIKPSAPRSPSVGRRRVVVRTNRTTGRTASCRRRIRRCVAVYVAG